MLDYKAIKKLAKDMKTTVKDLLALSCQHDPFYVGSPAEVEKAEWFARVYEDMGSPWRVHIRRIHYNLVAKGDVLKPANRKRKSKVKGKPYTNTENDWNMLENASLYARYLGLVPMENFVDRRNPPPIINAEYYPHGRLQNELSSLSIDDVISSLASPFKWIYNPQLSQAYHLEIWCEKSTMNDVIKPAGDRYSANVVTGLGEMSLTAVRDVFDRIREAQKPTRIFYVSDFDPAGERMPVSVARKLEYFMRKFGIDSDVKLKQIILTREQCIEFKLPRTPIKESDPRKLEFEMMHGTGATELDALEALYPGEMKTLLTAALEPYFDEDVRQAVDAENERLYDTVNGLLRERLSGLGDGLLDDVDGLDNDFEMPEAQLTGEDTSWTLDSNLNYIEQISLYKRAGSED